MEHNVYLDINDMFMSRKQMEALNELGISIYPDTFCYMMNMRKPDGADYIGMKSGHMTNGDIHLYDTYSVYEIIEYIRIYMKGKGETPDKDGNLCISVCGDSYEVSATFNSNGKMKTFSSERTRLIDALFDLILVI